MDGFPLWPQEASNFAGRVDAVYITLIIIASLFTIPVVGAIVYFGIRYRRGSTAQRGGWRPGHWLEYVWLGGMLVLVVPIYIWTAGLYIDMFRPPAHPIDIYVVGRQWMWKAQHANGRREINTLHVPLDQPIKLIMTSEDVIHSFYIPAFRVKHDVLPGRYSTLWFEPTKLGTYHLFCTEYCGTDHAAMGGDVIVVSQTDYQTWLNQGNQPGSVAGVVPPNGTAIPNTMGTGESQGPGALSASGVTMAPGSMVQTGAVLFNRAGCISCHHMDGSGYGPSLVNVYGNQVQLQDGTRVLADENYIRDSIIVPNAQVVAGYQAVMPSFTGQFSEEDLASVVAFVKSLSQQQ